MLSSRSTRSALAVALVAGMTVGVVSLGGVASAQPGWSAPVLVDQSTPQAALSAVSCPTAGACVAVDDSGRVSIFDGEGWSTPTAIEDNALTSVSCATTDFCVAVDDGGNAIVTTDGGTEWGPPVNVSEDGLGAVSCATTDFCIALDHDGNAFATTDGGQSWSGQTIDEDPLDAVSCPPGTSYCVAVDDGGNAFVTTDGITWSGPFSVDDTSLVSVSCPTTTFCAAADADDLVGTGTGGAISSALGQLVGGQPQVSCASTSLCLAVDAGGNEIRTSDGGDHWSSPVDIDGSHAMRSISCAPGTTFCVAVDFDGNAVTTTDGGTDWTVVAVDEGPSAIEGVSCATTSLCVAVDLDGNALTTDNGGESWTAPTNVDGVNELSSVSCAPGTTFCAAVDDEGQVLTTTDGGATWSSPEDIDPEAFFAAVSCAAPDPPSTVPTCVAVDTDGNVVTYDGSWSDPNTVDGFGFQSVSCATPTFCVALDFGGFAVVSTDGGIDWPSSSLIESPDSADLTSVSCTSPDVSSTTGACVAVDDKGGVFTSDDGSTWSAQSPVDESVGLLSVSCATANFCAAFDFYSHALVTNDGAVTWSAPSAIDADNLNSVSCPAPGMCVAVDDGGNALTYSAPLPAPTVNAVTFGGDVASPTVTVSGSGFGADQSELGPPAETCGDGADFGDNLNLSDTTQGWTAGQGPPDPDFHDCIGLTISSYSDTQIVFTFDSAYGEYVVSEEELAQLSEGDGFTLNVLGSSFSGTVSYPSPSAPDLSISTTADATPVTAGTTIGFTTTVANSSGATASAGSVSVNDPLPAGPGLNWSINEGEGEPGNCSITGAVGSQVLHCFDGDLPPGALASVDVQSVTTSVSVGTYPNTATASATNTSSIQSSATIVVQSANVSISTTLLPGGSVNQAYSTTVAASGGTTPYTWSIAANALPGGLVLNAGTGVISGIPTTGGTFTFAILVVDSTTPTPTHDVKALSIVVTVPGALYVSDVSPDTGLTSGGTAVTITGSGFTGATSVNFGESTATAVTVVNDTKIHATAPPGSAGTVDVTVTTPGGTSASQPADEFTYTVEQTPAVVPCDPSCTDTGTSPLNDTTVSVSGSTGISPSASMSLVVNTDTLACSGGYNYKAAVSTFSATGFAANTNVTVTETIGNAPSTKGVKVCYQGSESTTASFLRPCKSTKRSKAPCIVSLVEKSDGSGVVATFLVPANDPRFWAGGAPVSLKSFSPNRGPVGSTMTIKGKNLTGVVAVVIGGVKATVNSVSKTKLVVTVPPGALSGTVTVTAASGSATSLVPFTVT